MYCVLTVFAAVLAVSIAGPTTSSSQDCPTPPSAANASLADLAGALQYLKYYKGVQILNDLDGLAYRYDRQGESNRYTITIIAVTVGGRKTERTVNWTETHAENKSSLSIDKTGSTFYYSIPYLEKNKSYVMFTCDTFYNTTRQFTKVLTPNLDNDLTKAVEEARKIAGSNLFELPYKFKNAFLASKKSETVKD